jgi:hypothetical protein
MGFVIALEGKLSVCKSKMDGLVLQEEVIKATGTKLQCKAKGVNNGILLT